MTSTTITVMVPEAHDMAKLVLKMIEQIILASQLTDVVSPSTLLQHFDANPHWYEELASYYESAVREGFVEPTLPGGQVWLENVEKVFFKYFTIDRAEEGYYPVKGSGILVNIGNGNFGYA